MTVLPGTWIRAVIKDLVPCLRFRLHVEGSRDPGAREPVVVRPGAQGPRCSQAGSGRPGPAAAGGAAVPGSRGEPWFLSCLPSPVTSPAPKEPHADHCERLSTRQCDPSKWPPGDHAEQAASLSWFQGTRSVPGCCGVERGRLSWPASRVLYSRPVGSRGVQSSPGDSTCGSPSRGLVT